MDAVKLSRIQWQGIRYLAVGGFNVGFTLAVFWLLDRLYSAVIGVQAVYWASAIISIISGFIWQRLLVWRSKARWHREFLKFLVLNLTLSATNSLLLFVAVSLLRYPAFPSQVVFTAGLVMLSFVITRTWVFRIGSATTEAEPSDVNGNRPEVT